MDVKLNDNTYWVGYVDWSVRDFHSYETVRGATYNSYLISDEKIALIDTVKAPYWKHLLNNVRELVDPTKIDYIVCNHGEPDHSGALPEMIKAAPNAKVVCDAKGKDSLSGYYDTTDWNFEIVKTGDSISLGKKTLSFVETPMVHWPDSLMTYVPEDKLLFSMDGFGQHYASSVRFDDEAPMDEVMQEAKTYYANIVMPFGTQVAKTLNAAGGLDIAMIAPSHGIIWRKHLDKIINAYKDWCVCKPERKVVIMYDSMWESTAAMAREIYEGSVREGVKTEYLRIRSVGNTRLAAECLDAACIAVGSSTLNQNMMPAVASTLTYLKGLRPTGKTGFAFGSFGWGKGGPEAVHEMLGQMKFDLMLEEPYKCKWKPTDDILKECREMGRTLAKKAIEIAG